MKNLFISPLTNCYFGTTIPLSNGHINGIYLEEMNGYKNISYRTHRTETPTDKVIIKSVARKEVVHSSYAVLTASLRTSDELLVKVPFIICGAAKPRRLFQ